MRSVSMDVTFEGLRALSDSVLCDLSCAGNPDAETVLVERYARTVSAIAHSFYLTGADSDDLVQEGMIGLISAVRHYDSERNAGFATYAEKCIRHRLCSVLRTADSGGQAVLNRSVSLDTSLDESGFLLSEVGMDFSPDPEDVLISKERTDMLYASLKARLSRYEQSVLTYYLNGYSCREIASLLSRTDKSVGNAVQRIRQKIAQFFSGESSIR